MNDVLLKTEIAKVWEIEGDLLSLKYMGRISDALWYTHRANADSNRQKKNDAYYNVVMNDDEMEAFHFTLADMNCRIDSVLNAFNNLTKDKGDLVKPPVSGLADLVNRHIAAFQRWEAASDVSGKVPDDNLTHAINQLLAHRPVTIDEVRAKGWYLMSSPCFTEWSSVSRSDVIQSLLPERSS